MNSRIVEVSGYLIDLVAINSIGPIYNEWKHDLIPYPVFEVIISGQPRVMRFETESQAKSEREILIQNWKEFYK